MPDLATPQPNVPAPALARAVEAATAALIGLQRGDGHWAFELEADVTIPAEYLLLQHYLGEIDDGFVGVERGGVLQAIDLGLDRPRHPGIGMAHRDG